MTIADFYRSIAPTPVKGKSVGDERTPQTDLKSKGPSEFQKILENTDLNFSKHAKTRINSREIQWDEKLEKRIRSGMETAEAKGSREALILADDIAVIVNVKSRTIVTAMDRSRLKEKIFTNIDSTVLV